MAKEFEQAYYFSYYEQAGAYAAACMWAKRHDCEARPVSSTSSSPPSRARAPCCRRRCRRRRRYCLPRAPLPTPAPPCPLRLLPLRPTPNASFTTSFAYSSDQTGQLDGYLTVISQEERDAAVKRDDLAAAAKRKQEAKAALLEATPLAAINGFGAGGPNALKLAAADVKTCDALAMLGVRGDADFDKVAKHLATYPGYRSDGRLHKAEKQLREWMEKAIAKLTSLQRWPLPVESDDDGDTPMEVAGHHGGSGGDDMPPPSMPEDGSSPQRAQARSGLQGAMQVWDEHGAAPHRAGAGAVVHAQLRRHGCGAAARRRRRGRRRTAGPAAGREVARDLQGVRENKGAARGWSLRRYELPPPMRQVRAGLDRSRRHCHRLVLPPRRGRGGRGRGACSERRR